MDLYNIDCIEGAKSIIKDNCIDLFICDPPFGINESSFDKHYNRSKDNLIKGYVEAPQNYYDWTVQWLEECHRTLKPNGSMYLISGWTRLREILNAIALVGFEVINHIIWKFNFGVWTTTKYVSSHYHILYIAKPKAKRLFNPSCRYGNQERDGTKSLQNIDREDVWIINKDYQRESRNSNKLPNELIQKMIQYSSNQNDVVCDFFMGNFTTAYVAHGLARKVIGFELNKEAFDYHTSKLYTLPYGYMLNDLKKVVDEKPDNQGKTITQEEINSIVTDYYTCLSEGMYKKQTNLYLQKKYGRGKFSIINIIKKYVPRENQ